MEWARALLLLEGATATAEQQAAAIAMVYDKLHRHLAPLVGDAGVALLFLRSAHLTQRELGGLGDGSTAERTARLRALLQAHESPVALETAVTLFGTFFGLLAAFIGERLLKQALHYGWPTLDITQWETKT